MIVDITRGRPNCFIELGYALARGVPVMINAKKGSHVPFDTQPVSTNMWDPTKTLEERKQQFRDYWRVNVNRRRIVDEDPLAP